MKQVQRELSDLHVITFRNNVAKGWIGASTGPLAEDTHLFVRAGSVIVADARRLNAGLCVGSSDLVGWSPLGRFVAIECKVGRGRLTPEQANFLEQVRLAGGIAVESRTIEQTVREVCG